MKYLRIGVAVVIASLSVGSLLGCSEKAGAPQKEVSVKSFQGDPSKMPESAKQKMAEAQANAGKAATAGKESVKK